MPLPENFQYTQGSLQDYVDCPRRFQLRYIDQLNWPALKAEPVAENENYLQQGSTFHQLVQQYLLGVSIEHLAPIAEADPKLAGWWENFLFSTDNLDGLGNLPNFIGYPEFSLSTPIGGHRLIGKYDLLVIFEGQFIIYDWKTNKTQSRRKWVENQLQTRVYPYLLVQAGAHLNNGFPINPSQIKMVYWYANFPTSPIDIHFNDRQYHKDQKYINGLIEEIGLIERSSAEMTTNVKRCRYCVYRSLCNRGVEAGLFDDIENGEGQDLTGLDLDFEQIAEIEF